MKYSPSPLVLSLAAAAMLVAGCAGMMEAPVPVLKDGELALPADYKTWPKFLSAVQRPDAKLVKGELLRAFVMGKNKGWGDDVPEALRNGNWIYASYLGNGQKGPEPGAACRGCHTPLKDKDFVFRYDEHFAQKGKPGGY